MIIRKVQAGINAQTLRTAYLRIDWRESVDVAIRSTYVRIDVDPETRITTWLADESDDTQEAENWIRDANPEPEPRILDLDSPKITALRVRAELIGFYENALRSQHLGPELVSRLVVQYDHQLHELPIFDSPPPLVGRSP